MGHLGKALELEHAEHTQRSMRHASGLYLRTSPTHAYDAYLHLHEHARTHPLGRSEFALTQGLGALLQLRQLLVLQPNLQRPTSALSALHKVRMIWTTCGKGAALHELRI